MVKKLSYDEFIEYCSINIRKVMGEKKYKTSFSRVSHTDKYILENILVEQSDSKIITSIQTKEFYDEYLNGKTLGTIMYEMINILESHEGFTLPFDLDETFNNYNLLKKNLIVRAINFKNNENQLENNIFSQVADIALVIYSIIKSNDDELISVKIPKTFFPKWNVTKRQLVSDALRNTAQRFKPVLFDVSEIKQASLLENDSKTGIGSSFMGPSVPVKIKKTKYGMCLTTENSINGATAAFYPGVLERLGNIFDEDFYIVFMSIHEAVIHPLSVTRENSIRGLSASVKKNGLILNQTEFLSDNIYFYSKKTKQMKML